MSSDRAVLVNGVSKRFELYARPSDRLRQFVATPLWRWAGRLPPRFYEEFWALNDITFEVQRGESFGIVGRNGSGKSTLLQIITGTLFPTNGSVFTSGRIAALLELGSGFNPEFSGRENVFLNGALLGLRPDDIASRFDDIAAFADIGPHLEQAVKTYSSGMLVRLAIAVQVVLEPDILIVDEALAVGDAVFQKKCYRRIKALLDGGMTLLFVSHDQEAVRSLTQRSILLSHGKSLNVGSTTSVLFSYRELLQQDEERSFLESQAKFRDELNARIPAENSYGNLDVEILSVRILSADGKPCSSLYAGDALAFEVTCICHVEIENLNVAFRVINKEGVKVTTWGTLNEDMQDFDTVPEATFWNRHFTAGEEFTVRFSGTCRLAANLYELQVVVAREYDRYYAQQRILHWRDEAGYFTVLLRKNAYVFDGICDMAMRSREQGNQRAGLHEATHQRGHTQA